MQNSITGGGNMKLEFHQSPLELYLDVHQRCWQCMLLLWILELIAPVVSILHFFL